MARVKFRQLTIDTRRYTLLSPVLPFLDVLLQSTLINAREFAKLEDLATHYPNDPRLIEMVRMGGDASAKVPYLLDSGETADSILDTLRRIAQPHVEWIAGLPEPVRSTIQLLLSLNKVPKGCEKYGLPALLEIDRVQENMVLQLKELMKSRQLAGEFQAGNITALQMLDRDWLRLRENKGAILFKKRLPEKTQMEYVPSYDHTGRLVSIQETCVIVESPHVRMLQAFTPPVLQRPLPEHLPAPATGSPDWLIREVGKIGRHFTRALLEIIKSHLTLEQIALEARNYEAINQQTQEALREYIENTP